MKKLNTSITPQQVIFVKGGETGTVKAIQTPNNKMKVTIDNDNLATIKAFEKSRDVSPQEQHEKTQEQMKTIST